MPGEVALQETRGEAGMLEQLEVLAQLDAFNHDPSPVSRRRSG
jgi:hypothetical protein